MQGKYRNVVAFAAAWLLRERLRRRIANLVAWTPLTDPEPGCTAIIGMCSRLPFALDANLRCLYAARWPALKRVVITVDATADAFRGIDLPQLRSQYPDLAIDVLYYSARQSEMAERLKLPYVYSWMSWCIALAQVRTRDVLIQDYDALVFGSTLARRHAEFQASGARMQGVSWYHVNGLTVEDRLATTFEAFADAAWLRSQPPIALFNKIGFKNGRSVDYDTTLHMQDKLLAPEQRACVPMDLEELVHPSQMIHQYTMFRRQPGEVLPPNSMPMLPFFAYLAGRKDALDRAAHSLRAAPKDAVDLAGDGTRMNLARLNCAQVDWLLKQMVQALVALRVAPDTSLYAYGRALYRHVRAPVEAYWKGDFTAPQRDWIDDAAARTRALAGIDVSLEHWEEALDRQARATDAPQPTTV